MDNECEECYGEYGKELLVCLASKNGKHYVQYDEVYPDTCEGCAADACNGRAWAFKCGNDGCMHYTILEKQGVANAHR